MYRLILPLKVKYLILRALGEKLIKTKAVGNSAIIFKYCRFDHQVTKEEIGTLYWKQQYPSKY